MNRSLLVRTIASVTFFAFAGCATKGIQSASGGRMVDPYQTFLERDARLTCQADCLAEWDAARSRAHDQYRRRDWSGLVQTVSRVGYANDLSYFYLARAAEELGRPQSAIIYYDMTRQAIPCFSPSYYACDSVDVPGETQHQEAPLQKVERRRQESDAADALRAAEMMKLQAEVAAEVEQARQSAEKSYLRAQKQRDEAVSRPAATQPASPPLQRSTLPDQALPSSDSPDHH